MNDVNSALLRVPFLVLSLLCIIFICQVGCHDAAVASQLSAPQLPHVKHSGWRGLRLSWSSVKDADGYIIYRWSSKKKKYVTCGETTSTTWRDTGLRKRHKYRYKVAAYSTQGSTKSIGKRSYWISAITYARGDKEVNPGKVRVSSAASELTIGRNASISQSVSVSRYGRKIGKNKCRPFSRKVRWLVESPTVFNAFEWRSADGWSGGGLAKGEGTCSVRAIAANGNVSNTLTFTVSHNPHPGQFSEPKNITIHDPEVLEFLNDNSEMLWEVTEGVLGYLDVAGAGKPAIREDGTIVVSPYFDEDLRERIIALFGWDGFNDSVFLSAIEYGPDGVRLRFHSWILELSYPENSPDYVLDGPFASSEPLVAQGWRFLEHEAMDY